MASHFPFQSQLLADIPQNMPSMQLVTLTRGMEILIADLLLHDGRRK